MNAAVEPADLLSAFGAEASARLGRGEVECVEEYLSRHPGLADKPGVVLSLVYAEIALREQGKEAGARPPTLEEYLKRFPRHAAAIKAQWQLHELLRTRTLEPVDAAATTDHALPAPPRPRD